MGTGEFNSTFPHFLSPASYHLSSISLRLAYPAFFYTPNSILISTNENTKQCIFLPSSPSPLLPSLSPFGLLPPSSSFSPSTALFYNFLPYTHIALFQYHTPHFTLRTLLLASSQRFSSSSHRRASSVLRALLFTLSSIIILFTLSVFYQSSHIPHSHSFLIASFSRHSRSIPKPFSHIFPSSFSYIYFLILIFASSSL